MRLDYASPFSAPAPVTRPFPAPALRTGTAARPPGWVPRGFPRLPWVDFRCALMDFRP